MGEVCVKKPNFKEASVQLISSKVKNILQEVKLKIIKIFNFKKKNHDKKKILYSTKLINKSIRMSEWLNLIAQANTIIIETLLLI